MASYDDRFDIREITKLKIIFFLTSTEENDKKTPA